MKHTLIGLLIRPANSRSTLERDLHQICEKRSRPRALLQVDPFCLRAGAITLTTAIALSGCASLTRTPYEAPAVPLPTAYEHAHVTTSGSELSADPWWHAFGASQLDAWVALALERNADLAAAAIRVRRAALEARLAGNALLPTFSGTAATGASRPLSGTPRSTTETGSGNLGVSWEIDLFDRLGAQRDAVDFEASATMQDREAVALSLVASTANLYWQLGFANERIDFAQRSLDHASRTRELVDAQYRSGAVSRLEAREAEQSVAQQEVLLSQLVQARTDLRQAQTVLFDGVTPPGEEPRRLPATALPVIAAGLPAELLGRRPDLRAAELRLRASLATSDAAAARYYPTLSLTGGLGTSSRSLLDVLANPIATLGANLALPFLNVREMKLNTAIARTRYEEAVITFRKSLHTALSDVEKALSARTQLEQQQTAQRRTLDEAVEIERLYEARYRTGQVPLRAWLDAQERRRTAEQATTSVHLAQLQNQVTLYQVLGGGMPTQ